MKLWKWVPGLVLTTACCFAVEAPQRLRCEWRANPEAVRDPYPEFSWDVPGQSACRVRVAELPGSLTAHGPLFWDSGRIATRLSIVEYAGPSLKNGLTYYWSVQVWDREGHALPEPPPRRFRLDVRPMPNHLPTVRTFINFAGAPRFAAEWLDLCFRPEAKQGRESVLVTRYGLVCTMMLPHPSTGKPLNGKAKALEEYCRRKGLTANGIAEKMFCHFARDTRVRLHVGAERAARPMETRTCPGWDPRNDRNGDGRVDDAEYARLVNPEATARELRQARIPMYYWGPPNDDFVMNVGDPDYRDFMATVWAPKLSNECDGIYFDTVPPDVPGVGRSASVLEYPRRGADADKWLRDLQAMIVRIKTVLPDRLILGNAWDAFPMVADGRQSEGWEAINYPTATWRARLDHALELERRGKIQLLQYNPVFDPALVEFGPKLPVAPERDKMFGLATYLLVHGRFTYFGVGRHPYAGVTKLCFPAMRVDLGRPLGSYERVQNFLPEHGGHRPNLLKNGNFEQWETPGRPTDWVPAPPLARDDAVTHGGRLSARITSTTRGINNINKFFVHLKPFTVYTLIAWVKVDHIEGVPGAQVYPYEFDGVHGAMLTWTGTHDWQEQRVAFRTAKDGDGRINFRVYGATGTAWFDQIRLVEGMAVRQEVFARRYTKGLVLVKPYAGGSFGPETATAYHLETPLRPLRLDGTPGDPVHTVRLRNGEAAILLSGP